MAKTEIPAETEQVTIINGDGGFLTDNQKPAVMLTAGEAVVESFCDGSITRFKAPAIVNLTRLVGNIDPATTLPMNLKFQTCVADEMTGRWYGLYHRSYDGKNENVPVTIDLRQEPFTLETPAGVFGVNSFTIFSSRVRLEAVALTGKGTLKLDGTFDKGVLNFQYTEENVSGPANITRYGSGSAQRLYIAQWAVAPAAVDTPYNHPLLALTPATGDLTWSIVSGQPPVGIALDGLTGVLSGTPTVEGTYDFTVEVRDADGNSYKQPLTLNVNKLVVNTLFLPQAIPNQEFRFKVEVSGGTPPYAFNDLLSFPFPIPGPPTAKISPEGEIIFTPAFMDGTTQFEVVDSKGLKQNVLLVIPTRKLLIQGSAFLPSASAGQPFSFVFEAAGRQGPVQWEADPQSLEETGLSLNTETGELSGTPKENGVYSFIIMASDESSSMMRQFTLTVSGESVVTIPRISQGGVVGAASFTAAGGLSPGSLVSAFGSGFGTAAAQAQSLPLPTTLGDVQVLVNGVPAALLYVSPTQINLQLPPGLSGPSARLSVRVGATVGNEVVVSLAAANPAIFPVGQTGYGAIVKANTDVLAMPLTPGLRSSPVKRGDIISIYCTGLGATQLTTAPGQASSGLNPTTLTPTVRIGGRPGRLLYSGLAPGFVGLYQINVEIPADAPQGPQVPVTIEIGGKMSPATNIAVQSGG